MHVTQFLYLAMIAFVLAAVFTSKKINSIIYLSIFSLLASWSYIFDNAPDVAMAEAVIGSTLFTVLFLVAMKKYRRYRIFFLFKEPSKDDPQAKKLVKVMRQFSVMHDIQFDKVYVLSRIEDIHERGIDYDIVIEKGFNEFHIFGKEKNPDYQLFIDFINKKYPECQVVFKYIDW